MAACLQTFSSSFSSVKIVLYWFKFHRNLLLRFQLTINLGPHGPRLIITSCHKSLLPNCSSNFKVTRAFKHPLFEGLETLQNLTIRCVIRYWNGPLVMMETITNTLNYYDDNNNTIDTFWSRYHHTEITQTKHVFIATTWPQTALFQEQFGKKWIISMH